MSKYAYTRLYTHTQFDNFNHIPPHPDAPKDFTV